MSTADSKQDADYRKLSEKFIDTLCSIHQNFFRQTTIPIPGNNFMVLVILQNEGESTITRIGTILHMSKQQMTPIINKLTKDGFVTKAISTEDRRYTNISLTPKGQNLLDQHSEEIRRRFEQGALRLSPEEVKQFTVSLDIFVSSIEQMYHSSLEKNTD